MKILHILLSIVIIQACQKSSSASHTVSDSQLPTTSPDTTSVADDAIPPVEPVPGFSDPIMQPSERGKSGSCVGKLSNDDSNPYEVDLCMEFVGVSDHNSQGDQLHCKDFYKGSWSTSPCKASAFKNSCVHHVQSNHGALPYNMFYTRVGGSGPLLMCL